MRAVTLCFALTLLTACSALPEKPRRRPTAGVAASNLTRYEDRMFANEARLTRKWGLKQMEFETNCMFSARDLTQLIGGIFFETAGLKIDTVSQEFDPAGNRFISTVRVGAKTFTFHAPADAPRVDARELLPQLNTALVLLKPGELLALCRTPYDPETTIVAYGRGADLEKAVDDGFPADVPGRRWAWGTASGWTEGLQTEVTLPGALPQHEALREAYLQTAAALRGKGLPVPVLHTERLFVTDIFESGANIDLCVDGELCTSPATVQGQAVRCHWDTWGVLLAYTLVQRFNGTPALVASSTGARTALAPQAFEAQAESAFRGHAIAATQPL